MTKWKEINISVLDKRCKFEALPFKLGKSENYFEVYGTRITRDNKLTVICNLKISEG